MPSIHGLSKEKQLSVGTCGENLFFFEKHSLGSTLANHFESVKLQKALIASLWKGGAVLERETYLGNTTG